METDKLKKSNKQLKKPKLAQHKKHKLQHQQNKKKTKTQIIKQKRY